MPENSTNNSREGIRKIFFEVYKKKSPQERSRHLDEVCGSDSGLRRELESLLDAHEKSGRLLENPLFVANVTIDDSPISESPGTIIDKYKLLEKIGEGGMAVVYMAEQEQPIRRKVALKIIKLGMDTRSVIARFEAERQALAMMDHPNIAKVLDAGAAETGRPYFVMELVTGVSITDYCDANNLSTKKRLELFIHVCNAVQHAHQKGIIHRDIKPSNVMVTHQDGKPVPKVIDFGIAKATNQKLTEKTLFTRYAHIIGTPAYMSPEQAELSDLDLDTRTDIYSLGVLLYELLTGTPPFGEEELRNAGYLEMQRIIREQEPVRPSTKLSTLGETLTDIAKYRASTPDLLTKAIRGDLDWIVMKTLEKARERRYDNASALALDIQRHLKDESILARAPGTFYRLHKFFRRHRIQIVASSVVSVLAVALLVVFLVGKFKQRWLEREVFLIHKITFRHALNSFMHDDSGLGLVDGDIDAALADFESLFDSKYVGSEARRRYDQLMGNIRLQVNLYTENIKADPEDAESYLLRAQQYYRLREIDSMIADMEKYVNILNPLDETNPHDRWFRNFLIGLWRSTPTNLGPKVNTFAHESPGGLTPDGLSLFLSSDRSGRPFGIWVATRTTIEDDWGTPQRLGDSINTSFWNQASNLSADGLSLYFSSNRPGGYGGICDIWLSTRRTLRDSWGAPANLGESINSAGLDWTTCLSADGLSLYFGSDRQQGGQRESDIWVTKRAAISEPWAEPENLGETINSPYSDFTPLVWAEDLVLFFTSKRPGGYGHRDIWVSTRKTKDAKWGTPMNLGPPVNTSNWDQLPIISPDNSLLYFSSNRSGAYGGNDIWQVPILSVPADLKQDSDTDSLVESDKDED